MENLFATHLNWLAVSLATAAYFAIGFVWYGPLFGKAWGKEVGINMNKRPKTNEMIVIMGGQLVASFVAVWGLASVISWTHKSGVQAALTTSFLVVLFFIVSTNLGVLLFQKKPKLFLIDTSYHAVGLAVGGLILGAMQKNGIF